MESLGSVVRLSIPIHGNRPLKLGLLRHPKYRTRKWAEAAEMMAAVPATFLTPSG
jgi:hypothetical protein